MIGAIVGDIAGSRFEWRNIKSKQFALFAGRDEASPPSSFTDDTVMTLAVADAIMKWREAGAAASGAVITSWLRRMAGAMMKRRGAGGGSYDVLSGLAIGRKAYLRGGG